MDRETYVSVNPIYRQKGEDTILASGQCGFSSRANCLPSLSVSHLPLIFPLTYIPKPAILPGMLQLNLKPTHKLVRDYYATLQQYNTHNIRHEGAVSNPFAFLLDACAKQTDATLVPQYLMRTPKGNRIVIDGVILDAYGLPFTYWEAKDIDDNLTRARTGETRGGLPTRQHPLPKHPLPKSTARYPLSKRGTGF